MKLEAKIDELMIKADRLAKDAELRRKTALPESCYILDEDIFCFARENGDSRHPYSYDGITLLANASGYISLFESDFNIILQERHGKEPPVAFFGGLMKDDGEFVPVSLFELTKQPRETGVDRLTVFNAKAAYYLAQAAGVLFALRVFVDENKNACFSLYAKNNSDKQAELYLATYLNCILSRAAYESEWSHIYKECRVLPTGFRLVRTESVNHSSCCQIKRQLHKKPASIQSTASRSVFNGGVSNPLLCAEPLFKGRFERDVAAFGGAMTDTAIAGDLITFSLKQNQVFRVDYILSIKDEPLYELDLDEALAQLERAYLLEQASEHMLSMSFGELEGTDLEANQLNEFLKKVVFQVDFCAKSKNFAGQFLGVRDIFQTLEAALMWDRSACRKKIVEAIGFIDVSGRPPRQFAYPAHENALPEMDLREFIDQGIWIINTIYAYLSFTSDYTIFDEMCGYYDFCDGVVKASSKTDTVLEHLMKIADYLIGNIDKATGCLKILHGDWNDAIDGLGRSIDGKEEFGSGVSVMASLQLYQGLDQMWQMLKKIGGYDSLNASYLEVQATLKRGLTEHALEKNNKGHTKVLHGWGDKRNFKIGSCCDLDGADRDSLTATAFWVVADALQWDLSLKEDILTAYQRLDSKYGLKTFSVPFTSSASEIGRLAILKAGTAENAATYVHGTLFGIASLFKMGEPVLAWKQIMKILPLTHEAISTSPFVMPNSYLLNSECGLDGESMSDWYTGSANTLIKVLVRYVFGINPNPDGLIIQPASFVPCKELSLKINVKNALITLNYKKNNLGKRSISVNGKQCSLDFDEQMNTYTAFLKNEELNGKISIVIEN